MPLYLPSKARTLAQSAVAASLTGSTAETALATIAIPAGAMGLNGGLRIKTFWSHTSSANNKTLRIRLGGIGGTTFTSFAMTAGTAPQLEATIFNRNSLSSQFGAGSGNRGGDNLMTTIAAVTGAINTAAAQDLVISAQLALGTESAVLEAYVVELLSA